MVVQKPIGAGEKRQGLPLTCLASLIESLAL